MENDNRILIVICVYLSGCFFYLATILLFLSADLCCYIIGFFLYFLGLNHVN